MRCFTVAPDLSVTDSIKAQYSSFGPAVLLNPDSDKDGTQRYVPVCPYMYRGLKNGEMHFVSLQLALKLNRQFTSMADFVNLNTHFEMLLISEDSRGEPKNALVRLPDLVIANGRDHFVEYNATKNQRILGQSAGSKEYRATDILVIMRPGQELEMDDRHGDLSRHVTFTGSAVLVETTGELIGREIQSLKTKRIF